MDIADDYAKQEIRNQRLARTLIKDSLKTQMKTISDKVTEKLLASDEIKDMPILSMEELLREIKRDFSGAHSEIWKEVDEQLSELVEVEAAFVDSALEGGIEVPPLRLIEGAVTTATMLLNNNGNVVEDKWTEHTKKNTQSAADRLSGVIKAGVLGGLTNREILTQVVGRYNRKTKQYIGGFLNGKNVKECETLIRTGVNFHANQTRDFIYKENKDKLSKRIAFAVFDSRTSSTCQKRHLQEWDIEDPNYPRLPFHYNCRTIYLIQVKGKPSPLRGKRSSNGDSKGQVDSNLTMDSWLRNQSPAFIEETLGKTKAKLFLDGGMNIKDFSDLTGNSLTIEDMKNTPKFKKYFDKAGLNNE